MLNNYRKIWSNSLLFLMATLAVLQSLPFLSGYRLTADDVTYHMVVMSGLRNAANFVYEQATEQGRIVHFFDVPFTLLGAYYSENFYFRLFYTILHFLNYLLFGAYISKITRFQISHIIIVFLIILTPLDFYHLPPNAYPFHVSLPIFLIIVSRIGLINTFSDSPKFTTLTFTYYSLFLFGIFFGEVAFIFGVCLVLFEFFFRKIHNKTDETSSEGPLGFNIRLDKTFLFDSLAIMLFLFFYVGFRVQFPSTYAGNQITELPSIRSTFITLVGHIYGGTSIPAFGRHGIFKLSNVQSLTTIDFTLCIIVFLATFACTWRLLNRTSFMDSLTSVPYSKLLLLFLVGVLVAVSVTLPIAMVQKYQDWCILKESCIFHDSRVSFFGLCLSLAVIFAILFRTISNVKFSPFICLFFSVAISIISTMTFINNTLVSKTMSAYVAPWLRAQNIACGLRSTVPDIPISKQIDPEEKILIQTEFNVDQYWRTYISQYNREKCGRNATSVLGSQYRSQLRDGIDFSRDTWPSFLTDVTGLTESEPWAGRWSDANLAPAVRFEFNTDLPEDFILVADITVFGPNAGAPLIVKVGTKQYQAILPANEGILRIPVQGGVGARSIEFVPPNPTSPSSIMNSSDDRKLGIGFRKIGFEIK